MTMLLLNPDKVKVRGNKLPPNLIAELFKPALPKMKKACGDLNRKLSELAGKDETDEEFAVIADALERVVAQLLDKSEQAANQRLMKAFALLDQTRQRLVKIIEAGGDDDRARARKAAADQVACALSFLWVGIYSRDLRNVATFVKMAERLHPQMIGALLTPLAAKVRESAKDDPSLLLVAGNFDKLLAHLKGPQQPELAARAAATALDIASQAEQHSANGYLQIAPAFAVVLLCGRYVDDAEFELKSVGSLFSVNGDVVTAE